MFKLKINPTLLILAVLVSFQFIFSSEVSGKSGSKLDTILFKRQNKQADKKFAGLAYVKAIPKYENLIEKGFSPDSVRRNLAISYFKIHDPVKAEALFYGLILNDEATVMDIYYYAQSLKNNEKYDEADKWMEVYQQNCEKDSRGVIQAKSARVIKGLLNTQRCKVEPVYFNTKYSEFGASILDSQIVFTSGRREQAIIKYEYSWKGDPYLDVFTVPINKPDNFKDAELLTKGISSRFHDGPICFSSDGKEVYLTRSNFHLGMPKYSEGKENHFMIYHADRKGQDWGELIELPFNSPEYSCGHPALSADNAVLYFASDMPGGFGGSDIYYVSITETGWSDPVNMGPSINTEGDEMFPFVSDTGDFYFSSNGLLGLGGLDIFMASPKDDGSYTVINMGSPINSSADDFTFYLLSSGTEGYFASNRDGGKGDDDIYRFQYLGKPVTSVWLSGTTKDMVTGKIVPYATVNIANSEDEIILNEESDENGHFEIEVVPYSYYTLMATKENFEDAEEPLFTDLQYAEGNIISTEILLTEIVVPEEPTENIEVVSPDEPDNTEVFLPVAEKVLEPMIVYYDLAKWNIRTDAAKVLDEVVQLMLDDKSLSVELTSHTDARGSNTSNDELSRKRSESVIQYLVDRGISRDRISANYFGEKRLTNRCSNGVTCTEEEQQENRRTEITFVE